MIQSQQKGTFSSPQQFLFLQQQAFLSACVQYFRDVWKRRGWKPGSATSPTILDLTALQSARAILHSLEHIPFTHSPSLFLPFVATYSPPFPILFLFVLCRLIALEFSVSISNEKLTLEYVCRYVRKLAIRGEKMFKPNEHRPPLPENKARQLFDAILLQQSHVPDHNWAINSGSKLNVTQRKPFHIFTFRNGSTSPDLLVIA